MRSCYEAGRDGFWIHRWLASVGISNVVVDSSSIEVKRRMRRVKTDRVDAVKLLEMLRRYHGGEQDVWSVVRVPEESIEDERRLHRELARLKKERTQHRNRIRSALVREGLVVKVNRKFLSTLEGLRRWDETPLNEQTQRDLKREFRRLELVEEQMREVEAERREKLAAQELEFVDQVRCLRGLRGLRGIGEGSAWVLVLEIFA